MLYHLLFIIKTFADSKFTKFTRNDKLSNKNFFKTNNNSYTIIKEYDKENWKDDNWFKK